VRDRPAFPETIFDSENIFEVPRGTLYAVTEAEPDRGIVALHDEMGHAALFIRAMKVI